MEDLNRRSVAAVGVACSLLLLLVSLVAAEPLLAPPRDFVPGGSALPVVFEANRGQADPRVKFLARGTGYGLFITTTEAVLADRQTGHAVRVRLAGARPDVEVIGLEPLPSRIHHIRGRDPAGWQTGVPTYARVAYREAYPGVDAIYRVAAESRFEQEFLVRPGADPTAIRLEFEEVQRIAVDDVGDLVVATERSQMRLDRPVAYQDIDGVRRWISAAWVMPGSKEAGFRLGPYDRSRAVVIDPVITWATYLGGSHGRSIANVVTEGRDQAFGVAVDSAGNSYVTGDTTSVNFPTTDGSHVAPGDIGATDVFVTKLDPTGQALVYSVYIGGSGSDGGRGIAVDPSGNAYVAGFTTSFDFPTTAGAFQSRHGGGPDAFLDDALDGFVLKLGPAGTLVYATYLGGRDVDVALGIAVDAAGRAHVVGGTRSDNFPVANALQPRHGGGESFKTCPVEIVDDDGVFIGWIRCPRAAFVTRLSAQGLVEYSTFLGGNGDDVANAIALDDIGSAYVTGSTRRVSLDEIEVAAEGDFPTTPGTLQLAFGGGFTDAFVARIDANASLGWATYLGGVDTDVGVGVAVDGERRPYVVGSTASTNFPATGGDRFTGLTEGFVVKLAADGSAIVWSRNTGTAIPAGVALDGQGRPHVVGSVVVCTAFSSFVPPTCDESHVDVSVETRAATGERLSFISFGGKGICCGDNDFGQAIAASGGSLWVAGTTNSSDLLLTPAMRGTFQPAYAGGTDAFVVRLGEPAAAADSQNSAAGGGDSSGRCLIATAAFGSPLAREVATLRRFRDRALATHAPGRLFVDAYYRLSPPLASAVARQPLLAAGVRTLLRPVAFGAGFALDRPTAAIGFGVLGLAFIVSLAVIRGRDVRWTKASAGAGLLLGSLLLIGALVLSRWQSTPSQSDVPSASVAAATPIGGRSESGALRVRADARRPQKADVPLDLATLAGRAASVTLLDPFAPAGARRWAVVSELIEGTLGAEGFVVANPHRARALGIEAGDTIARVNGHPPTGLIAVIGTLQRDPDRATVVLEIDRAGSKLIQSYRVR